MSFRSARRAFLRRLESAQRSISKSGAAVSGSLGKILEIRETRVDVRGGKERTKPPKIQYFNPLYWLLQILKCFGRYITSREAISGIQGLPALVGFFAPLLLGYWLAPSREDLILRAQGQRNFYAEKEDFERADFFARQLCGLLPGDSQVQFDRALLVHSSGKHEEAEAMILQLATDRQFEPAMEWICDKDLRSIETALKPDETALRTLMNRLQFLLNRNTGNRRANLMLGLLYLKQEQFGRAVPPLMIAVGDRPEANPEAACALAMCLRQTRQWSDSIRYSSRAADALLTRMATQPYSSETCVQTLRALILSERESEALDLVQQLAKSQPESEQAQLNWLAGEVCAQWCRRLRTREGRTAEDLAKALVVMNAAISMGSQHPSVTDEMVRLCCLSDLDDAVISQQLSVALDSGVAPGLVHFIQGTRFLLANPPDQKSALHHLELARTHSGEMPGLLNNLADAMLQAEDADLNQAFSLVQEAIRMMPDQPYFYETRGSIHLKRNEYREAIADLEKALAAPELRSQAHQKLARAYEGLGDVAEAERHMKMSEQNQKKQEN
jgi:tetratricopeptide (TPR) repeat protein